jgi:transcriptional regulator with XRE-family HTH domain
MELDYAALATAVRQRRGRTSLATTAEETGISTATLSRLERGSFDPDVSTLLKVCDWIGVGPNSFVIGPGNREAPDPERAALVYRLWLAWGGDDADQDELLQLIRLVVGVRTRALAHGAGERERLQAEVERLRESSVSR